MRHPGGPLTTEAREGAGRVGGRHADRPHPPIARQPNHRQHALQVAEAAVQRQLAQEQDAPDIGDDLFGRERDADGNLSRMAPPPR